MKKKLLILACFVLAIGTYATVTGVQNSVLIQNVLANDGPTVAPDGGGGNTHYKGYRPYSSTGIDGCKKNNRFICSLRN